MHPFRQASSLFSHPTTQSQRGRLKWPDLCKLIEKHTELEKVLASLHLELDWELSGDSQGVQPQGRPR